MTNDQWKPNLCCIATYKVLEGDDNLDQFEEETISFNDAKDIEMSSLRYYPKTTNNSDILEVISYEIARKFLKLIVKNYSVKKQKTDVSSAKIISSLAAVFRDKSATISELAKQTDDLIMFSDE